MRTTPSVRSTTSRCLRSAAVHGEPEAEVRVVIQVRARRNDPVDEPRLDQRDERSHPQPRRSERAGDRQADRHVRLEHRVRVELARLPQPRRVVRQKCPVDQICTTRLACRRCGGDRCSTAQELDRGRLRVRARARASCSERPSCMCCGMLQVLA